MNSTNNYLGIKVPEQLLRTQELLPSAKLVWIALSIDSGLEPRIRHSRTRLAERTGLTRPTVYKAMTSLKASGWYSEEKPNDKSRVSGRLAIVYIDLFLNTTLSIQARLFHSLLQLTSGFKEKIKQLGYSSFSKEFGIGIKAVRKSVRQLVQTGWLAVEQANQLAPIFFNLKNPIEEEIKIIRARAEKNLFGARFKGEALMKEFLSLMVHSDDFMDNVRPNFLRNPETDSLMELDRYYPSVVAFEYNGTQHYAPTELYDATTVEKQRSRDIIKKQICVAKGIELVIIRPQDLTLTGMKEKINDLLPLRSLRGSERLVEFLERLSAKYRKNVPDLGLQT